MKKASLVVLAAALLGFVQYAQAEEVKSVNVVGFYKITVPPQAKMVMAALQFDAIDPANQNLLGIFGTNTLLAGSVPSEADRLYLWDTGSSKWKQYYLMNDDGDFPWQFSLTSGAASPTNPPLKAGQGFFIQSPNIPDPHTVTIAGQVVAVATQKVQVVQNFQLLGYPFSSSTTLKDLSVTTMDPPRGGEVPSESDRVYLYDSATGYKQYWLGQSPDLNTPGTNWFLSTDPNGNNPTNPPLALGQGFFYQAKSGFEWVETNAYINNL